MASLTREKDAKCSLHLFLDKGQVGSGPCSLAHKMVGLGGSDVAPGMEPSLVPCQTGPCTAIFK